MFLFTQFDMSFIEKKIIELNVYYAKRTLHDT